MKTIEKRKLLKRRIERLNEMIELNKSLNSSACKKMINLEIQLIKELLVE